MQPKRGLWVLKSGASRTAKDTTTNGLCQNVEYDLDVEVSHSEVINAINELSDNKSCGLDGIHAEHLKHCSDRIIPLLSKCFTGLLVHSTLPESMIAVVLVPIVKNECAKQMQQSKLQTHCSSQYCLKNL